MSEIYEITLEKEVLREMAAGIHAKFTSYILANNINSDNFSLPIVMMYNDVSVIKREIIPNYNTISDLKIAHGKLKQLDTFIENLRNGYDEKRAI